MSTSQNRNSTPILDYYPAELHKGTKGNWRIEFYVLDPVENEMKRFQRRVRPIPNQRYRERYAKIMRNEINSRLEKGWNPIVEDEAPKSFAKLQDVADQFINQLKKAVKDQEKRPDTLRAYTSYMQNLINWLKSRDEEDLFCINYNRKMLHGFLDEIYYVRDNSPRTHNNYLAFLRLFGNYMLSREYISQNPAEGIERKNTSEKKRVIIPPEIRVKIKQHYDHKNRNYLNLLMTIFYQLVRRTEATKLKVGDINLNQGFIKVRPEVSKNGKLQYISILPAYIPYLIDQIKESSNSDFLFSDDNFRPGEIQLKPKSISDEWAKSRKKLELPTEYQLYSFKDTGITEMLKSGIPAIDVKQHARHSTIAMTEKYVQNVKILDSKDFKDVNF